MRATRRRPSAILTGGSLLAGSVGRTDLLGPESTAGLTSAQYRTIRRLAALPDDTGSCPTHGSGSFCAAGPLVSDRVTTIGAQRRRNPLLAMTDEASFAAMLLAGLGRVPGLLPVDGADQSGRTVGRRWHPEAARARP